MFRSLRIRLTLIFVGLAVIPVVVVGQFIAQRGSTTLQEESLLQQSLVAERVSIEIENFFTTRENEMIFLDTLIGIPTLDARQQQNNLSLLMSFQNTYEQLTLLDSEGQIKFNLTRTGDSAESSGLNQEALFAAAQGGEIAYSPVRFDEVAREPLITVAVPLVDLFSGNISDVLLADIRFKSIWDLIAAVDFGTGQDIYVVDTGGNVVAHRNPSIVLRGTVFDPPAQDGRSIGLSDPDVILATNTIQLGSQEFVIVSEQSFEVAAAFASELLSISVVATVVALIVAIVLVIFAVRQIVRPVEALSKVASAIQGGDLSVRARAGTQDEIGQLARAFNSMTDRVEQSIHELETNVSQLEESKRANERLIRELESALLFKDQFLATMSHELRTPMNAIMGYTGIALSREGVPESVGNMLERIKVNSRRLLNLINDVLDIARINADRVDVVERPFNLRDVANGWAADFTQQAQVRNLTFEFELSPTVPSDVIGDEERISQITANLLTNALKFTEEGTVSLHIDYQDGNILIDVSDTGIGIPDTWHHLIFEEFRQVDMSSKRQFGGAGLGLSIVQKLCILMKGNITVSSKLGAGSAFVVTLPLQAELVEAVQA